MRSIYVLILNSINNFVCFFNIFMYRNFYYFKQYVSIKFKKYEIENIGKFIVKNNEIFF